MSFYCILLKRIQTGTSFCKRGFGCDSDDHLSCFDSGDVSVFIYCCYRRITGCIDKVFSCCVSGSFPLYIALFSFSDVNGIICGFFDAELHYIGSIVRSFCLLRLLSRFCFWLGRSFCLLRFLGRFRFWLGRSFCLLRFLGRFRFWLGWSFCLLRFLGRFRFWLGRSFCLLRFLRRLSFWLYRFRCCSRFYYWFRCCWFSCSFFCDFYRNGAGCLVKGSGRFCVDLDLCGTSPQSFQISFFIHGHYLRVGTLIGHACLCLCPQVLSLA